MDKATQRDLQVGRVATLKRAWDDLRTLSDLLGPFTTPIRTPAPDEVENIADGVEDVAGRLYKVAETLREGLTKAV